MDMQVRDAVICRICGCSLDVHEPHAIVNHDYAHLDCADAHDAGLTPYYSRAGQQLDSAYNAVTREV